MLLLLIPLSADALTAIVLVFLMGLTGFTANPVVTALAVRFAGDAPTLASAVSTSAVNVCVAAGSWLVGTALDSPLGLAGPPLVGTVTAAFTLLPLTALALRGAPRVPRIVAQGTAPASARREESAEASSHR